MHPLLHERDERVAPVDSGLQPLLAGILLGVPLLLNHTGYAAMLKSFPRSSAAAYVFFGAGAAWFLYACLLYTSPSPRD